MGIEAIVVVVGEEFRRVVAALETEDERIPAGLRRSVNEGAAQGVREARAKVEQEELAGGFVGKRGLQTVVASGVKTLSQFGPQTTFVRIETTMPTADEAVIPRGMDRPRGWSHPVFGHRDRWVVQPGGSWFMDSMQGMGPEIESSMTNVLEDAAHFIAAAGLGA